MRNRPGSRFDDPANTRPLASSRGELGVLRRVAPYLWPGDAPGLRLRVVVAMALLVAAKLASVLTPWLFGQAVDALETQATPPLAAAPALLAAAYVFSRLAATGFQQLRDAVFARVGQRALRRIARQTFAHIHTLPLRYHLSRRTGGLSRIVERGVKGVEFLLRYILFSIVPLALELAMVAAIFLAALGWPYFTAILLCILAYVAFTSLVTEYRLRLRRRMNASDVDANQKAVDSLLNFETVKYFTAESREEARYDAAMAGYEAAAVRISTSLAVLNAGQAAIIGAGLLAVMLLAARDVAAGSLTPGEFVMANAYVIQIAAPLGFLGTVYREIRQALVDMSAMFALLDQKPEVTDAPDARALQVKAGHVRFRNVRFGYDPDREILKGVDFEIPPNGAVAVVGASGAGKSTLSRLLFRFYDVGSGAIEIDGVDLRALTQGSLRAAIGVAAQDAALFNDTIGYNIGYGRAEATQARIEEAARAACIHDFIARLPEGYDTMVGERGLKLSGGERQRIAIARAMLKDPPILILDEATSALDTRTEQDIARALRRLSRARSVLMIAHRLSTVVEADEILVMADGVIAERGRHQALLARGGRYAAMWRAQETESPASARAADAPGMKTTEA